MYQNHVILLGRITATHGTPLYRCRVIGPRGDEVITEWFNGPAAQRRAFDEACHIVEDMAHETTNGTH